MGASALRPKPTVHNGLSNKSYKPQEPDYPLSPVSPLDSNGETWKYPPNANTHLTGFGNLDQIPLEEVPANTRLSRPFEQPYSVYTSEQIQASAQSAAAPMQANMMHADSHLRSQPAQVPSKKVAPPRLTIPKPAHQPRRQREPTAFQENPAPTEPSDRRQQDQTRVQGPARHQGWNPLKESPRRQNSAHVHGKNDRRGRGHGQDIEQQGEYAGLPKGDDRQGRIFFISLMVIGILGIVGVVVLVKTTWGKG